MIRRITIASVRRGLRRFRRIGPRVIFHSLAAPGLADARSAVWRFTWALLAVALTLALGRPFGAHAHALVLTAIATATLVGGAGPGLLTAGLSFVALHVLEPHGGDHASFVVLALFYVAGASTLASAILRARRAAETATASANGLRASEARFRGLVEAAPDAIVICDATGRIALVNGQAERVFGYDRAELLGRNLEELMPQRFRHAHRTHFETYRNAPVTRRMGDQEKLYGLRRDGSEFPIETNLSPLGSGPGLLLTSIVRDLTRRRELEEREALLARELNHRVKNVLASVQSIAAQTFRATTDPALFEAAFTDRIRALSQSHDLLTRNSWAGADVADLIAEQLAPYLRDGSHLALEGPAVTLGPQRSVTFGMTIGELATNAAKYGAIATGGGVDVQWRVVRGEAGDRLRLSWREWGGPPVAPPTRKGFGTKLIERSLEAGLQGHAELEYGHDGLAATLEFPLRPGEG